MKHDRTPEILDKALNGGPVSADEGLTLFMEAPFGNLLAAAHSRRMQLHPEPVVTWIIDRNVNISNVCHAGCLFCNFSCSRSSSRAYITTSEEYHDKIRELFSLGGNQLLLQGGLHPDLGLQYYEKLFSGLKKDFPELRLHALGPPEIVHLAKMEGISYGEVLEILQKAGLDSLPGAGAEILSDRVRKMLSPGKCSVSEWLQVMQEAHQRHITTSATMMFGHVETLEERFQHLILLRETQALKPEQSKGFISFIPWPFQDEGTALSRKLGVFNQVSAEEYIRFIAVSRLMLHNIPNLQPSWLTVGIPVAQICLHAGANDFGSVMIEEHVVSSAGASYSADSQTLVKAIRAAGFIPARRNQDFEHLI